MNIKKVDDKPMVIHTKEKTKLHVKTAPETKIKAGNVLTVERTPKFAGAEREAKADNMDKRMSALKVKFATKDSTYNVERVRKDVIAEYKEFWVSKKEFNYVLEGTDYINHLAIGKIENIQSCNSCDLFDFFKEKYQYQFIDIIIIDRVLAYLSKLIK